MKTGKWQTPCRKVITPTLALVVPHLAITLYFNGGSARSGKFPLFELADVVDIVRNNGVPFFDMRNSQTPQ